MRATEVGSARRSPQTGLDIKAINEILRGIPEDFFDSKRFNPFNYWGGEKQNELKKYAEKVDAAIAKVVEATYKGFNAATLSFSQILHLFTEAQQLVARMQGDMNNSQRILAMRNHLLKELWFQSQQHKIMLHILSKIEFCQAVPAQLDVYLKRRQYLHAVRLLQHAVDLVCDYDLKNIPGLLALREELLMRKNAMQSLLVEELHAHIYSTADPSAACSDGAKARALTRFVRTAPGSGSGKPGSAPSSSCAAAAAAASPSKQDGKDGGKKARAQQRRQGAHRASVVAPSSSSSSSPAAAANTATSSGSTASSQQQATAAAAAEQHARGQSTVEQSAFSPFSYAPTDAWLEYVRFLDELQPIVVERHKHLQDKCRAVQHQYAASRQADLLARLRELQDEVEEEERLLADMHRRKADVQRRIRERNAAAAAAAAAVLGLQRSHSALPAETASPATPNVNASAATSATETKEEAKEDRRKRVEQLLAEEYSDAYLADPTANSELYMSLIIQALDELHALPSLQSAMNKRVRNELKRIVETEVTRMRQRVAAASGPASPKRPSISAPSPAYGEYYDYSTITKLPSSSSSAAVAAAVPTLLSNTRYQGVEYLVELVERVFDAFLRVLKHLSTAFLLIRQGLLARGITSPETEVTFSPTRLAKRRPAHARVQSTAAAAGASPDSANSSSSSSSSSSTAALPAAAPLPASASQSSQLARPLPPQRDPAVQSVIESIWEVMQIELQILLCAFLESETGASSSAAAASSSLAKAAQEQELTDLAFSFEDSAAPSVAKMSHVVRREREEKRASSPRTGSAASRLGLVQPSPYNVTVIYRPVVLFTDEALALTGGGISMGPNDLPQLRQFINLFIQTSYLSRVEADVNVRVRQILDDVNAFDARELRDPTGRESGAPMLQSVIDIADLLRRLFTDCMQLPGFAADFVKIADKVIQLFLEKCQDKYQELTAGTYSAQRLASQKIINLLKTDPTFVEFCGGGPSEPIKEEAYFSENCEVYRPLFDKDFRLLPSQLLLDEKDNAWSLLALLSESLDWLAEWIVELGDPSSPIYQSLGLPSHSRYSRVTFDGGMGRRSQQHGTSLASSFSLSLALSSSSSSVAATMGRGRASYAYSSSRRSLREEQGVSRTGSSPVTPVQSPAKSHLQAMLLPVAEKVQALADKCLFTLRLEVHYRYFYHLKEMQTSSYWCAVDAVEPEPFITALVKDMRAAHAILDKYFRANKIRYVFGGSHDLLATLLIWSIAALVDKRVNKKGVDKLMRNSWAVQQQLTAILPSPSAAAMLPAGRHAEERQESPFERARSYYELLRCTDEELRHFQLEYPDRFSREEYQALWEIITPERPNGAAGATVATPFGPAALRY